MAVTRRVLVTRPEPGASTTARRLRELGFEPMVLPLTEIVSVVPEQLPDAAAFDALTVTSANAIRHAPSVLLKDFAAKPVFAVGERSADLAREAGFGDVRGLAENAEDLAAKIRRELPAGKRLLYLAGAVRREGFEHALAGLTVETVVVYDARAIERSATAVAAALDGQPVWGALVYSARGGVLLTDLIGLTDIGQHFERTMFFCISQNAAMPLSSVAAGRLRIASQPNEEGILALLDG